MIIIATIMPITAMITNIATAVTILMIDIVGLVVILVIHINANGITYSTVATMIIRVIFTILFFSFLLLFFFSLLCLVLLLLLLVLPYDKRQTLSVKISSSPSLGL